MDDLYVRLQKALDEAEEIARGAAAVGTMEWGPTELDAHSTWVLDGMRPSINPEEREHIARWDPSTVLRLIERDRKLLAEFAEVREVDMAWTKTEFLYRELERAAEFWLTDTETTDR